MQDELHKSKYPAAFKERAKVAWLHTTNSEHERYVAPITDLCCTDHILIIDYKTLYNCIYVSKANWRLHVVYCRP